MGGFLTIDKHVSNLEDVLELNPRFLAQTKFESHLPPEVTHHIKVPCLLQLGLEVLRGRQQNQSG